MLTEAAPDVWEWTSNDRGGRRAFAVRAGSDVVLVDPNAVDAEEEAQIRELGTLRAVLVTGAHHERAAGELAKRFNVPVYASHEALPAMKTKAQAFPSSLPCGLEVLSGAGSVQGAVSVYLARDGGTLIVGDFLHNIDMKVIPWPIRLILMGIIKLRDGFHFASPRYVQDPALMLASARKVLDRPFERILFCHGSHIHSGGHARLEARIAVGP